MINQLFRINFESNLPAFIVFLALNALLSFIVFNMVFHPLHETAANVFPVIVMWLLVFCLIGGGISLLRHNKEKRTRLYSQLPVTPVQVRAAYWVHASAYAVISSLVLAYAMYNSELMSNGDVVFFSFLNLFHTGVLMAIVSIVTGNTVRIIPEEIRRRTIIYFFLATALTFLLLLSIGFTISFYVHLAEHGSLKWNRLLMGLIVLFATLVAFDIHLFRKRENYLG